ncbi:helicase protein [Dictyocaulus viviparus]|uniref:Helicase protein n=1 Tax=Dictyocaulus viviparus TaxID=29172 RepID=A0A0D8XLN1_DICVI|nr:helicase protein [Dictyocaulus viviparus]
MLSVMTLGNLSVSEPAENNGKLDESNKELTMNDQIKEESIDIIRGALVDPGPDMVVCDEGHKIKNLNTDIAAALSAIQTRRRIVLTGYPLQNNLMEYYCMVDFVRPDFLGSRKNFSIQFERPIRNGQCIDSTARDIKIARQRIHVLNNMLRGFIQRRTHHLLKAILPEAKEFVLLLRKSPLQHALYRNFVMYANAEISSGNTSVFNPLKAFAACSKIWNHPDILAHTLERKREDKKKWAKKDSLSTCTSPALEDLHPSTNLELITIPGSMPPCISNPKAECNLIATDVNRIWSPGRPDFRIPSSIHEETKDFATASEAARITHHDLWRGVFDDYSTLSFEANNAVISNKDDFNRNSAKSKHSRSRNIQGVLEDEVDITDNDQDLQYDWAETTMASYKTGNIEHGYKMVMAMELLDATVRIGEKMLIFSQNLTALDLIESYLCNRPLKTITGASSWMKNVNFFRLDGSTPAPERERLINRFNSDPGVHLFLISTKAGSLGINLVAANRCIIFDACWNPCHDAQAVCRVYRRVFP